MSIYEKLKPRQPKAPIGKVEDCRVCGYKDCEFYTANYQKCPRCDGKIKPTYELADDSWDDVDTSPGWPPANAPVQNWTMPPRWFRCGNCSGKTKADPMAVAGGLKCACGGCLYVLP